MTKGKLIKTERTINIYKKSNSNVLEEPTIEINIDSIPLDILQQTVTANTDDPYLYDAYNLNEQQLTKLNSYLNNAIVPDLNAFEYYLECYGIYDWKEEEM
jgi:hypothetical protein